MTTNNNAKVLFMDIETSPLISYTWGLWDQNVALNQIHSEWFVLSWSASWQGSTKITYQDQSKAKDIRDDKKLLEGIWKLLNEADVVIGQNSRRFDVKKLNARFIMQGLGPTTPFRQIDTLELAKKSFAFTSNKLEWLSGHLAPHNKKMKTKKFQGFELWKACLAGDKAAWAEMKAYNMQDVVALKAVYDKLAPWGTGINFNVYSEEHDYTRRCNSCNGSSFIKKGFAFTNTAKRQKYQCTKCGSWTLGRDNLLTKEKRKAL
jgi:uncharacterized protein YprB with RNaseH-like and TPR domain